MVSAQVKQEPQLMQDNTVYTETHTLNLTENPAGKHSIKKKQHLRN